MGEQDNHEENVLNELPYSVILLVLVRRKITPKVFRLAMLIKGSCLLPKEKRLRQKLGAISKGDKGFQGQLEVSEAERNW